MLGRGDLRFEGTRLSNLLLLFLFLFHTPLVLFLFDLAVVLIELVPPRLALVLVVGLLSEPSALLIDPRLEAVLEGRRRPRRGRSSFPGVPCHLAGGRVDVRIELVATHLL